MTTPPDALADVQALLERAWEYAAESAERERIWEGRRDYRWQEPKADADALRALAAAFNDGAVGRVAKAMEESESLGAMQARDLARVAITAFLTPPHGSDT